MLSLVMSSGITIFFRFKVKSVISIYKIPHLKLAFFVIPSPEDMKSKLPGNKKTMECFERILLLKDRMLPTKDRQWRIKKVHDSDFLQSIKLCKSKVPKYTNRPFDNLECMELLTLSAEESCDFDPTYFSSKSLDMIEINDIIEVFI
jgi:hypothetical protein